MNESSKKLARRATVAIVGTAVISMLSGCGGSLNAEGGSGQGSSDGKDDNSVTVGLSVPQSGVYAQLGEDMTQGFNLYLEEHGNQLGGYEVKVVTADEGEGPQVGVAATERLITQDQADVVVGIVNSATALGLRDTFVQAEVPLVIANAGANEITADPSPYIWRASHYNSGVSGALGQHVAEEVGTDSVYLIAADYAAGKEHTAGFRKAYEAAGGKVAGETLTPFGTTNDWQPYLSQIRNSGASAVFAFYAGSDAANFVKQYDTFGLADEIQLYGSGFLVEGDVLNAQGDSALGIQTSLNYSDMINSEHNHAFVEAYEAAYGESPTVYSVQAYDAVAAIDAALESVETVNGVEIAKALSNVGDFETSPRGKWSFDENHDPDQLHYLREVQKVDGELKNVVVRELEG